MNTTHTLRHPPRRWTTTVATTVAAAAVLAAAACGDLEAPAQDVGNAVPEAPVTVPKYPYAPDAVAPPKDTSSYPYAPDAVAPPKDTPSYPYAPDAIAPRGLDDRSGESHGFRLRKQAP